MELCKFIASESFVHPNNSLPNFRPDRARRQGNLCDLADMYVLDYAATLKTLAARKLIQMKTTAPDLPPLGLCLYKEYYYMSQRNIITNDR